jgi:hypothetical protein
MADRFILICIKTKVKQSYPVKLPESDGCLPAEVRKNIYPTFV